MLRMPKVWLTLAHYFQLDERLTRGWWLALMHSKWSEPVAWRNVLVLYDRTETPLRTPDSVFAFLQSACPPQKVVEMIELLVQERQLSRAIAAHIEEKVLQRINREGRWL